jgi:peptidoglycan L-alanyl-D-glutamate endopeptidase CwlK
MSKLSVRSFERLKGVHGDLIRVVALAANYCPMEFIVTEGVRTLARQQELYAKGRTTPGPVVTNTMKSRHLTGHAVDLAPIQPDGSINWNDPKGFDAVYEAMLHAASDLKIPLRSGMDWDRDGVKREKGESDSPHYELPASDYP